MTNNFNERGKRKAHGIEHKHFVITERQTTNNNQLSSFDEFTDQLC